MANYLTRDELASELGISKRTLARYAHLGIGPRFAVIGGRARYRREAVDAWLRENEDERPTRRPHCAAR